MTTLTGGGAGSNAGGTQCTLGTRVSDFAYSACLGMAGIAAASTGQESSPAEQALVPTAQVQGFMLTPLLTHGLVSSSLSSATHHCQAARYTHRTQPAAPRANMVKTA